MNFSNFLEFIFFTIEGHLKSQIPIFLQSYFDIIIANDVVEHLVGTEDFVKFVYKSLKPGGLFLISFTISGAHFLASCVVT